MIHTQTTKPSFDYLQVPPHQWSEALTDLKLEGIETISIKVPWGAHEAAKGMRDFSRSSKLRLERLLKSISENQMRVEVTTGFFSSGEMIPAWAFACPKKTIAPSHLWDDKVNGFSLTEVPSLFSSELWNAFQEFSDEVIRLCSLYTAPHGPVEKVRLDLRIFSYDCELFSYDGFLGAFQDLYPTENGVNAKYNVILKNTPPITSSQSFKVLYKSRPWLASFDYKFCRERVLEALLRKACSLPSAQGMQEHFEVELFTPYNTTGAFQKAIAIDATFLEFSEGGVFSFCPEGMLSQQSAYAFRMAEYFQEKGKVSGHRFFALPLTGNRDAETFDFIHVICGKYLTRASFRLLEKIWMRGGNVFFPFGLPQFDEQMKTFEWAASSEKKEHTVNGETIQFFSRGLGKIWSPLHPFALTQDIWEKMETARLGIENIGKLQ